MNVFYINQRNDTSSDTLLTLGWAEMVRNILRRLQKKEQEIIIQNTGGSFEITLPCTLTLEDLHSEQTIPFLKPLISTKQDEKQAKKLGP